jgi:Cu/Zn superoxide dismutase
MINFTGLRTMTQTVKREYHRVATQEAANFVDQLKQAAAPSGTFDSAAAQEFVSAGINQNEAAIPEKLQTLLDEVGPEDSKKITKAIFDGISIYEAKHGVEAPGDVIEQAIHVAYGTSEAARSKFKLDSATSNHSDTLSLQPNRAVVAILSALGEAIPFAHYLPADIGSNEAKLAILSHQAGTAYGAYAQGGLMDGTLSGDAFITSSRIHATANSSGAHTGQLTSIQSDADTCQAVGGSAVAVKLLRGRSLVYINGKVVAREISSSGSGNSTVSGSVTISGTEYQIGGTINTDTGAIALTSTPALADAVPVHVEGFIDYERAPELTPSIITQVETFPLFAKPWRVTTHQTIDAGTQMNNELGLDPYSEGIIAIQAQFGNNSSTYDFAWATMGAQKTRAQVWQDFSSVLGAASQQMAVDTLSHGISHLYVGKYVAAQLLALAGTGLFVPSGISARPSIYRLGRLFGQFDVYYTPKVLTDSTSASQILAIGRANDVTRNPFVLGDAVSPIVQPLAINADLKRGAGFYARNFTEVNPHSPSALGCALINITNMGL